MGRVGGTPGRVGWDRMRGVGGGRSGVGRVG